MELCNFSNCCRVIDVELLWFTEWWQLMVIIPFLLQICIGTIDISKELKSKAISIASSVPILSSSLQNLCLCCSVNIHVFFWHFLSLRSLSSLCSGVSPSLLNLYNSILLCNLSSLLILMEKFSSLPCNSLWHGRQHEPNKEM